MTRSFEFGVGLVGARDAADLRERSRLAEEVGFTRLGLYDHFHAPWAPLVTFAHVAAVTSSIRLTYFMLDNNVRHPAVLAKEGATLDVLSDGRLELGLGAGSQPEEHPRFLGLPVASGRVRLARLAEAVAIVKGLWGADELSFDGTHYSIDRLMGLPKPLQQPRPPLRMGGFGKRMLSLAAREAEFVNPWLHDYHPHPDLPMARPHDAERNLLERRERYGISTFQISGDDRIVRDFAPIIERLGGPADARAAG